MNLALHKLKENFSWQVKYWLVLLAITIVIDLSAIGTYSKEIQHLPLVSQDSLLLRNNNGQRTFTVEKGQEVKIWLNGRTDRGAFLKLENDMMSISKKGTIIKYNVLDISKIKVFGNLETKVIGYGFKIWGALIIFAGIMVPFLGDQQACLFQFLHGRPVLVFINLENSYLGPEGLTLKRNGR